MPAGLPLKKEQLERVARRCATNKDAGAALGIHASAFARACKRHGIETPHQRRGNHQTRIIWKVKNGH